MYRLNYRIAPLQKLGYFLSTIWGQTCDRSDKLRYFFEWNSFSSSRSCSLVKAVRRRRDFDDDDDVLSVASFDVKP